MTSIFVKVGKFHLRPTVLLGVILSSFLLQACATPTRLAAVPDEQTTKAVAVDTPNGRFYPDEQIDELVEEGVRALRREMNHLNILVVILLNTLNISGNFTELLKL